MASQCRNCATPLSGEFCSQCGQSSADLDLSIGEFFKEIAGETLSLDSRLRLTLKPLFTQPGAVARDYVGGQRARFVPPIRLYILASFLMFLVMAMGPGLAVSNVTIDGEQVSPIDSLVTTLDRQPESADGSANGLTIGERLRGRLARGLLQTQENTRSFSRDFLGRFGQAMFLLLPAFAGLLKVVHRRRLYIHHLVFAVYLHSFVFLSVALVMLPNAVGFDTLGRWSPLALLPVPFYLLFGMRRFYGEAWPRTAAKFLFVSVFYTVLALATWIAVLIVSLMLSA